jgi:hypothetical protein
VGSSSRPCSLHHDENCTTTTVSPHQFMGARRARGIGFVTCCLTFVLGLHHCSANGKHPFKISPRQHSQTTQHAYQPYDPCTWYSPQTQAHQTQSSHLLLPLLLIRDPGLAEPRDPGSLASQLDDSWCASWLARRAREVVSNLPHTLSLLQ